MKRIEILQALGEEKNKIEAIYLDLKINKALQGEDFSFQKELNQAKQLFELVFEEYFTMVSFCQGNNQAA